MCNNNKDMRKNPSFDEFIPLGNINIPMPNIAKTAKNSSSTVVKSSSQSTQARASKKK